MNLQQIPRSSSELAYLDSRRLGFGHGQSALARCVAGMLPAGHVGARACNNPVYTGTGYADLDGAPFKAYYCPHCAALLLNNPLKGS